MFLRNNFINWINSAASRIFEVPKDTKSIEQYYFAKKHVLSRAVFKN